MSVPDDLIAERRAFVPRDLTSLPAYDGPPEVGDWSRLDWVRHVLGRDTTRRGFVPPCEERVGEIPILCVPAGLSLWVAERVAATTAGAVALRGLRPGGLRFAYLGPERPLAPPAAWLEARAHDPV